jgi:hypothetical protein
MTPSAFNSIQKSKEFRRNPSPDTDGQKALTVIQYLSWGSIFPLLSVYLKHGTFSIYYLRASRGGLRLGSLLAFFNITVSAPLKIDDLFYIDTPHGAFWKTHYQVIEACCDHLDQIETLIETHFPKCTAFMRKHLAANVSKTWQVWIIEAIFLRGVAQQLGQQEGIANDCVILISKYASLLKILNLSSSTKNSVSVWPQPNQNETLLYPPAAIGFSLLEVLRTIFRSFSFKTTTASNSSAPFKIGITAAWGIEGMDKSQRDDLYWWRNSSIAADHLIYMFENIIQPTPDKVKQVKDFGIKSVALNPPFPGDWPNLLVRIKNGPSFLQSLRKLIFITKLAWKTTSSVEFSRAVLALAIWQYSCGGKLAEIYKTLNLKGVFHYEEAGMDIISLASVMNDSMRIGAPWSSHTGINQTTHRSYQVCFLWGNHDAQIALDSGSISRSLLIAGCFVSDLSNKEAQQGAEMAAKKMRNRGVRYILTLIDNSPICPNFYRFFLQWLLEDSRLGLLIKSKGKAWKAICSDGLNGLVECANDTQRMYVLDSGSSPADTALLSDFTVGITNIAALVVSALKGARVIFLDYERVDQGPQKPYCILHSLGPNRCVFYEPDLLRQAIVDYFENPALNPSLGDVTPILDQLDPFRDGKASQRIGEFVAWYLEELDNGLNAENAVCSATDKYADKWGADKVIRNR